MSITVACRRLPVIRSSSRFTKPTSKRALCATSTAPPANFENRRSASRTPGARRSSASESPVSIPTGFGSGTRGCTSVWKQSRISSSRTRTAPISQIRADACARPVVSRSKTTKCAAPIAGSGAVDSATNVPRHESRAS